MKKHQGSFDFILNTIPVGHEMDPYLGLLKIDATMVLVGAVEPLKPFHGGSIIMGRKRIAGSLIGGIKETQEMLDFCGKHNITSDIELINCHNDCQTLVIKHYPKVANLLSWLLEYAPSRMTGTGACIFTHFNSKAEALLIQSKLPPEIQSFVAKGINESPLLAELKALRDTTKLFK